MRKFTLRGGSVNPFAMNQAQDYALLWPMKEGNGQRERGGSGTEPKSRVGLGCQSKTIGDNDLLHITTMMKGPVEYAVSEPVEAPGKTTNISERECSKKFVQQGRSRFDARSVLPYVSANAAKSGKSVSPKVRQKGENAAGGFFQHSP